MITFDESRKIFTLNTKNTSYQMMIDPYGVLLHLYYSKRLIGTADFVLTYADRGTMSYIYDADGRRDYSYDGLPQEYPTDGQGDMRSPAIIIENSDGSESVDLRYTSHTIAKGKYSLKGLPSAHANDDEACTLSIILKDKASGASVELLYGVIYDCDVITRSVIIRNEGNDTFTVKKVLSANLDFVTGKRDLITFYGRHGMERKLQREDVCHGEKTITSRRGASSHQYNPMLILCDKHTTEEQGNAYAMQLVYSGGFMGTCEKNQIDATRLQLGLSPHKLSYPLAKGEELVAPEVILSYSADGLTRLSHNLHKNIKNHICRSKWTNTVRPIVLNSWEAFYFSFDGEKILGLADMAAEIGLDMLVLDDGWFGERNDDNAGLGDWFVNEEKLGMSIGELAKRINDKGVKFGIWVEPEMVNEDSDLYRKHPDWALVIPGRSPVLGRNQLVLDMSRGEVVDYLYERLCDLLDNANIEYVKWDYNRVIVDVYSHTTENQGKVLYDYIIGLYDLLERIVTRYPDLLIEGCCGGGGRFDAGMLYYTPQIWCSDNTDAIDRLRIQYGTSFGYPQSTMGAHVSAVPNEMNGRVTPLNTRSIVAMAGTYGYEMDPRKLSNDEREEIKKYINDYKKYAPLIQNGSYYRLSSPFAEDYTAWAIISADKKEVLFSAVITNERANPLPHYVRLKGLSENTIYHNESLGEDYSSDVLMNVGLPLPNIMNEYAAYQWYLTSK